MKFNDIYNNRIVVELGSGDGVLIKRISDIYTKSLVIGIEINTAMHKLSLTNNKNKKNVLLYNKSFEKIIPKFGDNSISKVISILPDPKYIDKTFQQNWIKFYKLVFNKLQKNGTFFLITEVTNELFGEVSDDNYNNSITTLIHLFQSIGFKLIKNYEGYSSIYSTTLLKKFNRDKKRIRISTFKFKK